MKTSETAGFAGAGAALLALVLSSCCALPMALVFAGVSTAVVGTLNPLFAFRPYMLALAAILLTAGWWLALRRGSRGAYPVLIAGTALVAVSFLWPVWDPMLQRLLLEHGAGAAG